MKLDAILMGTWSKLSVFDSMSEALGCARLRLTTDD